MYQLLFCLTSSQQQKNNSKQMHKESACGMVYVCVCVCVCVSVCVCVCVCVQSHIHTHTHTHAHAHTHTHTHTQDPSQTASHLLKAILVCSQEVEGVLQEREAQPVQHQCVQVHRQAVQAVPGDGALRCSRYLQHKYKQDHDHHVYSVAVTGQ